MMIPKRIAALACWTLAAVFGTGAAFPDSFLLLSLAIIAILCGVLFTVQDAIVKRRMALSTTELDAYGNLLADATPEILEMSEKDVGASDIARQIKSTHGVPEEITLKYIIALGKYSEERS